MIYEVWYKNGVDLDYFGSREAAELYIEMYIDKRIARGRKDLITREDYEIREKYKPTGCDYGIGG